MKSQRRSICKDVAYIAVGASCRWVSHSLGARSEEISAFASHEIAHILIPYVNILVLCHPSMRREMGRLKRSPAQPTLRSLADSNVLSTGLQNLPSPGLTTTLNSNNPFRNRAASPANSPVVSSFGNIPNTAPERPTSRNPFLDRTEKKASAMVRVRSASPDQESSAMNGSRSPTKPALTGHAVDLFVGSLYNNNIVHPQY